MTKKELFNFIIPNNVSKFRMLRVIHPRVGEYWPPQYLYFYPWCKEEAIKYAMQGWIVEDIIRNKIRIIDNLKNWKENLIYLFLLIIFSPFLILANIFFKWKKN